MLILSSDPAGPTFLKYTPNGRKLVTTGTNSVIRVYETGSDGEPINIDDCQENNTAVATSVRERRCGSFPADMVEFLLFDRLRRWRCMYAIAGDVRLSEDAGQEYSSDSRYCSLSGWKVGSGGKRVRILLPLGTS